MTEQASQGEPLLPGLHERLVTRNVARLLASFTAGTPRIERLDVDDAPDVLVQHLAPLVRRAIRDACGEREDDEEDAERGKDDGRFTQLYNQAIALLGEPEEAVDEPPQVLKAIVPLPRGEVVPPREPPRPGIPLSTSALLVNARDEHRIGVELVHELASADSVDLVCSFVKWTGLRVLLGALRGLRERGGRLRVLTTAYMGATESAALDQLCRLGAEVKISYDTRRTRLHAKAWILHRRTGYTTAYIGSSNLSSAALLDGLEWNVRLSAIETPHITSKFTATFDAYWADAEFVDYRGTDEDRLAFRRATKEQQRALEGRYFVRFDVQPHPHQSEILDKLEAERTLHGSFKNLIVAATGTGKTIIAALDYRRARALHGVNSLLFVAHRKEILDQSLRTFRGVMGDGDFGERWVDGDRPLVGKHVFASIQSLHRAAIETLAPDAFDYVIVDEFHHAEAESYARVLGRLRPKILLGLTATPERADGKDVRHWFDGRVAAELRLWLALERGLLCPFQYFGHHDDTDLSRLPWTRGGYDRDALEQVLTGNDARDRIVLTQLRDKIGDPSGMRALGFCASVPHAKHMARVFLAEGIPSVAVDSNSSREERDDALRKLRDRELNAVFAVDLFNEGVDVPEVDTVLFLRPTESVTVFLQQLGRGLRLAEGKVCLTVLDFVGQAHRNFRFDLRYRALTGATRAEVVTMVKEGFPVLPPGCAIHLDRLATERVLKNIKDALGQGVSGLAKELVAVARRRERMPTLSEFLADSLVGLPEVYGRREHGWTAVRRRAAAECPLVRVATPGMNEAKLSRMIAGLIHVTDAERLSAFRRMLLAPNAPVTADLSVRQQRIVAMLYTSFWKLGKDNPPTLDEAVARLRAEPALIEELGELFDELEERADQVTYPIAELPAEVPIRLHATYTKDEVLAAFGRHDPGKYFRMQGGAMFDKASKTDMFFSTIQKSERDYSPRTMYRDYAISPTLFHCDSPAATRAATDVGRRYQQHVAFGTNVLMFVRRRMKDARRISEPYICLGLADYVSHEGERPMAITWRLRQPMPTAVFTTVRLAAG